MAKKINRSAADVPRIPITLKLSAREVWALQGEILDTGRSVPGQARAFLRGILEDCCGLPAESRGRQVGE